MRKKVIPIMLLLLISMATPVVVSMAIPKDADDFFIIAVMEPVILDDSRGVQKYTQEGVLYDTEDYDTEDPIGTIELHIVITNVIKGTTGRCARARVHFIMDFDARTDIHGTIVGKSWFDEEWVQHVDGIFVGRGSHVKGKVYMIAPNVVVFDGKEW